MNKHGQLFSVDFIIASLLFLFVLIMSGFIWNYNLETIDLRSEHHDLQLVSNHILPSLTSQPGTTNWTSLTYNTSNIQTLGLAHQRGIIDPLLWQSLGDPSVTQELLGIKGPGYNFQLQLLIWNESTYVQNSTHGVEPFSNASHVTKTTTLALYDGNKAQLNLFVWQECGGDYCE